MVTIYYKKHFNSVMIEMTMVKSLGVLLSSLLDNNVNLPKKRMRSYQHVVVSTVFKNAIYVIVS